MEAKRAADLVMSGQFNPSDISELYDALKGNEKEFADALAKLARYAAKYADDIAKKEKREYTFEDFMKLHSILGGYRDQDGNQVYAKQYVKMLRAARADCSRPAEGGSLTVGQYTAEKKVNSIVVNEENDDSSREKRQNGIPAEILALTKEIKQDIVAAKFADFPEVLPTEDAVIVKKKNGNETRFTDAFHALVKTAADEPKTDDFELIVKRAQIRKQKITLGETMTPEFRNALIEACAKAGVKITNMQPADFELYVSYAVAPKENTPQTNLNEVENKGKETREATSAVVTDDHGVAGNKTDAAPVAENINSEPTPAVNAQEEAIKETRRILEGIKDEYIRNLENLRRIAEEKARMAELAAEHADAAADKAKAALNAISAIKPADEKVDQPEVSRDGGELVDDSEMLFDYNAYDPEDNSVVSAGEEKADTAEQAPVDNEKHFDFSDFNPADNGEKPADSDEVEVLPPLTDADEKDDSDEAVDLPPLTDTDEKDDSDDIPVVGLVDIFDKDNNDEDEDATVILPPPPEKEESGLKKFWNKSKKWIIGAAIVAGSALGFNAVKSCEGADKQGDKLDDKHKTEIVTQPVKTSTAPRDTLINKADTLVAIPAAPTKWDSSMRITKRQFDNMYNIVKKHDTEDGKMWNRMYANSSKYAPKYGFTWDEYMFKAMRLAAWTNKLNGKECETHGAAWAYTSSGVLGSVVVKVLDEIKCDERVDSITFEKAKVALGAVSKDGKINVVTLDEIVPNLSKYNAHDAQGWIIGKSDYFMSDMDDNCGDKSQVGFKHAGRIAQPDSIQPLKVMDTPEQNLQIPDTVVTIPQVTPQALALPVAEPADTTERHEVWFNSNGAALYGNSASDNTASVVDKTIKGEDLKKKKAVKRALGKMGREIVKSDKFKSLSPDARRAMDYDH